MRPIYNAVVPKFGPASDIYKARLQLLLNTGAYCSFCELPPGGEFWAMERVSTSRAAANYNIDGDRFQWYAGLPSCQGYFFNQLMTCVNCQLHRESASLEGTEPAADWRVAWGRKQYPSNREGFVVLSQTDPAMYREIRQTIDSGRYLSAEQQEALYRATAGVMTWPDTSIGEEGEVLFQGTDWDDTFLYEYAQVSQATLAAQNLVRQRPENLSQPWAQEPIWGVWVRPNPRLTGQALQQAWTTLLACNLNYCDPFGDDIRVQQRTAAYFAAGRAWTEMGQTLGPAMDWFQRTDLPISILLQAPVGEEARFAIRSAVMSTGFWSVWRSVFRDGMTQAPWNTMSQDEQYRTLFELLIQYEPPASMISDETGDPPEPQVVLKGTDANRIRTPWHTRGERQ